MWVSVTPGRTPALWAGLWASTDLIFVRLIRFGLLKNKVTEGGSAAARPFLFVGADVLIGPAGGCVHPPLRLIARAALVVCCDSPGRRPAIRRGALPTSGAPPKPSGDGRGFGGERSRSGRSELCRLRRSEVSGACGDAVTLRALRDGQLLTAPPKIPLDCVQPVFGLRSSLLPCSRALHASILPHFRAKERGVIPLVLSCYLLRLGGSLHLAELMAVVAHAALAHPVGQTERTALGAGGNAGSLQLPHGATALVPALLDTLLLGTAIYDTSLGSCPGRAKLTQTLYPTAARGQQNVDQFQACSRRVPR